MVASSDRLRLQALAILSFVEAYAHDPAVKRNRNKQIRKLHSPRITLSRMAVRSCQREPIAC